ncbi:MAG: pentapeptide repeat-containing protein, partial [Beijerinckiaceae bacterium]
MADETKPADEPPAETQRNEHVKAFFLDLAAKGKDAWNAWRRDPANKRVRVTFAGVDFRTTAQTDQINFTGFDFGDGADFSGCKWGDGTPQGYTPGAACFNSATIGDDASFAGAVFGHHANFNGAVFGHHASVAKANFGLARFTGASFGDEASFIGAEFDSFADFNGAIFGSGAHFDRAIFKGPIGFTGQSWDEWKTDVARVRGIREVDAIEALKEQHKKFGSGPDRFLTISYAGAHFFKARTQQKAGFSGRSFERVAEFTNARFYYPPSFETDMNYAHRIDFTGAHVGFNPPGTVFQWTSDSTVPIRLRALRKIAEETKNHDLERDLYIEERKAERGVYWNQLAEELEKAPEELKKKLEDINRQKKHVWLEWRLQRRARNAHWIGIAVKIARLAVHGFWIIVMGNYWALSDYGRSFVRPAAWLAASGFFFYWQYCTVLAKQMAQAPDIEKYKEAVGMLAL